jgi:hypothetical protein
MVLSMLRCSNLKQPVLLYTQWKQLIFKLDFIKIQAKKKVVSKLTTESREETLKLSFGAMQYMGLIII